MSFNGTFILVYFIYFSVLYNYMCILYGIVYIFTFNTTPSSNKYYKLAQVVNAMICGISILVNGLGLYICPHKNKHKMTTGK